MSDLTLESLYQSQFTGEPGQPEEQEPEGAAEPEEEVEPQDAPATDAEPEAEGEEPEDEEEGAGQPEKEPEPEQDRVVKWKTADGEEYEVQESELRNGYMRQRDYTQKTQDLASERERAQSEIQNTMQRMNAYGEGIANLGAVNYQLQSLESAMQRINRQDDPGLYATYQAEILAKQRERDQLVSFLGQAQQHMQSQSQQDVAKKQVAVMQELQAEIPGFGQEMLRDWDSTARTYGFTAEELSQVTDKRLLKLLGDAAAYRKLQTRKPEVVKKVAAAPKPAKNVASTPPTSTVRAAKAFEKSRSLEDLARMHGAR